ncbi:hypothetical protein JCM10295v2_001027 [Rhodotorula toruloides]
MDQLLSQNGSLFIAKIWVADEVADEVLNERATFEDLYRHGNAADYLVGYAGFFESTIRSHYLLVTEAGEAIGDCTKESDAVIKIVERLHQHGYVHGDLAERKDASRTSLYRPGTSEEGEY